MACGRFGGEGKCGGGSEGGTAAVAGGGARVERGAGEREREKNAPLRPHIENPDYYRLHDAPFFSLFLVSFLFFFFCQKRVVSRSWTGKKRKSVDKGTLDRGPLARRDA